jgi:hypothetical protein
LYKLFFIKEKFPILFIALATAIILLASVIPHHHHHGVPCIIPFNSAHSNHHGDNDMHQQSCVAESDYIIDSDNPIKCKILSCDNCYNPSHYFPVLYLIADFLIYPSEIISPKPEYEEGLLFYTSAEVNQFHGLRAPPFFS